MGQLLEKRSVHAVKSEAVERWNVIENPHSTGGSAWAEVLAATHVAFDVRASSHSPESLRAKVRRRRIDDLLLVDCESGPFVGHRGSTLVNSQSDSMLGIQVVRRGTETARTSRGSELSTRGHVKIWTSSEPVDIEVVEPFVKRTLIFPLERVVRVCPQLSAVNMVPALTEDGGTRLLVRYLDSLATESLTPAVAAVAAQVALELLRAALEPALPASRSAKRMALRADVRRYVHEHLQDPFLTPLSIARAHAMSLRTLHALFEETDESVAALIRRERLARCRLDLERPNGGGVTEIALRWGFRDPGNFSRTFRREFGLSPREVRQSGAPGLAHESFPQTT